MFVKKSVFERMKEFLDSQNVPFRISRKLLRFECETNKFRKMAKNSYWFKEIIVKKRSDIVYHLEVRCDCQEVNWPS